MKPEPVMHYDTRRDGTHRQTTNQWTVAILACILLIGGFYWIFAAWYDNQHVVSVRWKGNGVALSIPMDSVYRVTCLAYDASDGEAIAELPEPLYLISSGGKALTEAQMKRLIWRIDRTGKETLAPAPGTPIWAMYARMTWSPERAKKRTY